MGAVLLAARMTDPWEGYCSTPPLSRFHQSQARNRYLRAASQVGKTMGCAREAWMYAGNCHPFRVVPRMSGLGLIAVGALEGTPLKGVLTALWNTRPDHLIDWERTCWLGPHHTPTNLTIYLKNRSVIKIVSSKGGSTGAAGVQADWVWIDEPPKKDKFSELMARVTQTGGHVWLSFTPVDSEQDLTYLMLYLEGDPAKGIPPESPGWHGINMALSVESCPWMKEEDVTAIYDQTPGWIADQRLRGAWDTPPVDAYFRLDPEIHALHVPFDTTGLDVGAWWPLGHADHGELAGHQHVCLSLIRKCRSSTGRLSAQVATVGEYRSRGRTSFDEDAVGIKAELVKISLGLPRGAFPLAAELADPARWNWVGDINSAGKGMAGYSANEALAVALGLRRDAFKKPDKSAGSVENGLVRLKTSLDTRPCPIRIARGVDTTSINAPELWRAIVRHKGKEDETKHALDAWRYGIVDFLTDGSPAIQRLPDPPRRASFAMPLSVPSISRT